MTEVRMVRCNATFNVRCVLCGDRSESKWGRTPMAFDGEEEIGDVCDRCAEADPDELRGLMRKLAASLRADADDLERQATDVRSLKPGTLAHASFQSEVEYCCEGF